MEFHPEKIASELVRLHLFSVSLPLVSLLSSFIAHISTLVVYKSGVNNLYDFFCLHFLNSEAVGKRLNLHQQEFF